MSFVSDEPSQPVSESMRLSTDLHENTLYHDSSFHSKWQRIRTPSASPPAAQTPATGAHQLNKTFSLYVVPDTSAPDISIMADVSQHSFVVPVDVVEPDIQGVPERVETAELPALTFAEVTASTSHGI